MPYEERESQGIRARRRAEMEAGILRLGREQLADRGPAALSLRQIARDLGVASSAVYRYVADRDALLTRLVVDAYSELADHVESALAADGTAPARRSLLVFAHAMREWGLRDPARWALIYGTPVPGYAAPEDQTLRPGTRLMAVLLRIVADSGSAPAVPVPTGAYADFLDLGARDLGVDATASQGAFVVTAWSMLIGTISSEVFGQLGPVTRDVGAQVLDHALALLEQGLEGS
ncbi:TetR/AcrR family transcriptional regulator [Brachybacterium sp. JHP9]|uniref:TetR/AcrR family transcriptional regulator n=1 Tax=Brachybacterium equifaecis TaxID=2910770 RepID=A0ABT0R2Q6_9MICO|nr:TetR/AcrR family transcriptional regulator [Brachybacterium equifaecis]MCL6424197.1 TetR/AcrR family transcriptional regulator [Brachybacterium equifaecis]